MDLEDGVPATGRAASLESPPHHSHDTPAPARPPASLDLSRAASWQVLPTRSPHSVPPGVDISPC